MTPRRYLLLSRLLRWLLPQWAVNLYLMVKWRCFISPGAQIEHPKKIKIGRGARIGRCHIIPSGNDRPEHDYEVEIGTGAIIHADTYLVTHGGFIRIGARTSINPFTVIYGFGGVEVGDDTRIATSTVIVASEHEIDCPETKVAERYGGRGIRIGQDVWIGAGGRVLDGVVIGDRAVVGAGAVVTKDVAPETVVGGVPARFLRARFR